MEKQAGLQQQPRRDPERDLGVRRHTVGGQGKIGKERVESEEKVCKI